MRLVLTDDNVHVVAADGVHMRQLVFFKRFKFLIRLH